MDILRHLIAPLGRREHAECRAPVALDIAHPDTVLAGMFGAVVGLSFVYNFSGKTSARSGVLCYTVAFLFFSFASLFSGLLFSSSSSSFSSFTADALTGPQQQMLLLFLAVSSTTLSSLFLAMGSLSQYYFAIGCDDRLPEFAAGLRLLALSTVIVAAVAVLLDAPQITSFLYSYVSLFAFAVYFYTHIKNVAELAIAKANARVAGYLALSFVLPASATVYLFHGDCEHYFEAVFRTHVFCWLSAWTLSFILFGRVFVIQYDQYLSSAPSSSSSSPAKKHS